MLHEAFILSGQVQDAARGVPGFMVRDHDVPVIDLELTTDQPYLDFPSGVLPGHSIADTVEADESFTGHAPCLKTVPVKERFIRKRLKLFTGDRLKGDLPGRSIRLCVDLPAPFDEP